MRVPLLATFVAISIGCAHATDAPQLSSLPNISGNKLLDCAETISKVSQFIEYANGTAPILGYSRALVIDRGDSFFVVNEETGATAYSDHLSKDWKSSFKVGYPTNGVMMGRGYGESAGSFIYIGPSEMISWDCRK